MNRSYTDWLTVAANYKVNLDTALADKNEKDVIYYRGKYLFALKQAFKLNKSGQVPSSITGAGSDISIETVINAELQNHQRQIDTSLKNNKTNSDIKKNTFSTELGLKIRRLATRVSQINFATGAATKKDVAKDVLGVAGSTLKAPFMVTSKVLSEVGPLAVTIISLPFTLFASFFSLSFDLFDGKIKEESYNNTVVHKMSKSLKEGIKNLSDITYKAIGKM